MIIVIYSIFLFTLHSIEDVSSLAEATSLVEVSLDGNPVALGGDCTPFLVSYLPNLVTLTNMHVSDQVRVISAETEITVITIISECNQINP